MRMHISRPDMIQLSAIQSVNSKSTFLPPSSMIMQWHADDKMIGIIIEYERYLVGADIKPPF